MSSTAKRRFNLSWLKPPAMPEDGSMALVDHLRELRYRVIVSAIAVVVGAIVCWFFIDTLLDVVMWPYHEARRNLQADRPDLVMHTTYQGVSSPFIMKLQTGGFAGLLLTCPIWLYQLWAFIAPGLLSKERRWALTFLAAAIPLFLAGVVTGYFVTPKGYEVMIGFVPENSDALALLDAPTFLVNEIKLLTLFGVSFLLPVVLVTLNLMGVVTGEQLGKARSAALFGCFVFAAVATPSTDPFSMLAMAMPMGFLYVVAELISRRHDKRKAVQEAKELDVQLTY
ncbi:twin-arginine translocase subunit TatC [Luteococcus sp. OSA5]|uniref:twin-arginine translocase subunit TatC n=1 Tax=Luteococcus sp. OSA5 TaxID=3401630 RepID=UPI003B43C814